MCVVPFGLHPGEQLLPPSSMSVLVHSAPFLDTLPCFKIVILEAQLTGHLLWEVLLPQDMLWHVLCSASQMGGTVTRMLPWEPDVGGHLCPAPGQTTTSVGLRKGEPP